MTAREYLEEIERKRRAIDRFRQSIDRLRQSINLLPGVRYDGDKVQTSTEDARVLRSVEKLVDMEADYVRMIEEYEDDLRRRIMAIHGLANPLHQAILYQRYVAGAYWWEIADKEGMTERNVYRVHQTALEELQEGLRDEQTHCGADMRDVTKCQ